jgi:hypothetical protein
MSAAQTFTIDTTPPAASFIWLPTAPYAGEAVSFASTATDPLSPITALAWDLGTGAFAPGGPVASTTFAAPGSHLVRLSATDAIGLSSVSSRTISVRPRPLPVMVPFPIVRLVGSERRAGTLIRLLAVEAPSGTSVSVTCRGRGCPRRAQRRIAPATRAGTAWLTFARFERLLRPGIFLAVRVFHPNEIGAYTSIAIRRGKLPHRVDECLDPVRNAPVRCSS